jgi:hypothetical protein
MPAKSYSSTRYNFVDAGQNFAESQMVLFELGTQYFDGFDGCDINYTGLHLCIVIF